MTAQGLTHFMGELLLIPCSNSKLEGGQSDLKGRRAKDELSPDNRKRLTEMRRELALAFDVELSQPPREIPPLMPAYRRYSGNLYGQVEDAVWPSLSNRDDVDLGIVSALYGLIYWDEPVVEYNVSMKDKVRGGARLCTWWKRGGLGEILANFINARRFDRVRSLLSKDYGVAVSGVEQMVDSEWLAYKYQGLGTGSTYYRGRDVNQVVLGDVTCPECASESTARVAGKQFHCNSCASVYAV